MSKQGRESCSKKHEHAKKLRAMRANVAEGKVAEPLERTMVVR
jgi:hypothetical protein